MGLVAKRVADKRILKLIRGFLTAGVMVDGLVSATEEGTPQGGPLSPLLSNLMLDELDKELEKRGHHFVRYADDCNIYVRSQRAGERVMASVERFLDQAAQAQGQQGQERGRPAETRKFLGFSFTSGKEPQRRIAPQALARFRSRVRVLTRRTRGRSLAQIVEELSVYLHGLARLLRLLRDAHRCCVTRPVDQAAAARRRLEAMERGPHRFAELDAAASAGTWRRKPPAVHMALGGSATAPRSPSPCPTPSSSRSALASLAITQGQLNPPNRRIRTRTYGGVGGEEPRGSPLSRFARMGIDLEVGVLS